MKKAMILPAAIFLWMGVFAGHGATAGENLPTILILGSLSKVYEPVRFNHAEHVSLAGGCGECHHQHRSLQLQTCSECHRFDPAPFKKNFLADKLLPCRDCHSASETPGSTGQPALKIAYHQACLKCHWGDVGSAGKNLEGCTEMCHALKVPGNREKKK